MIVHKRVVMTKLVFGLLNNNIRTMELRLSLLVIWINQLRALSANAFFYIQQITCLECKLIYSDTARV